MTKIILKKGLPIFHKVISLITQGIDEWTVNLLASGHNQTCVPEHASAS